MRLLNLKANAWCAAALVLTSPTVAYASCSDEGGYLYIWETCVQDKVSNPTNVCQTRSDARETQFVVITSNVIFDSGRNRIYPANVFFDEVQLQQNLTINGRESSCYATRREAEDALRSYKADKKRYWGDRTRFVTINMPNT